MTKEDKQKIENSYETTIMHPVLQDFLKRNGVSQAEAGHERPIDTTEMFVKASKKVKIDFLGTLNKKYFLIECKLHAYPCYIAQALGQLLVYKNIIAMKEPEKYAQKTALFLCFNNLPTSFSQWTPNHTIFLSNLQNDLKVDVGLLLLELKNPTPAHCISGDHDDYYNPDKLTIICKIPVNGLFETP